MEIVAIFEMKKFAHNYIIYKTLDNKHYYIAKYQGEDLVDLDTNLSEKEIEMAQKILEGIMRKNEVRD